MKLNTLQFFNNNNSEVLRASFCSGAFKYSDVVQAGSAKTRQRIQDMQRKLQFDDPINIQFTSVSIPVYMN